MSPRNLVVGVGLVLAFTFAGPTTAHAQIGGLVKKAKEKAVPASGAQTTTDQPARLPGPEITKSLVDRFLVGLSAEKDARARAAEVEKTRSQKNADEEKQRQLDAMDPQTRHMFCVNEQQQKDPKYATLQKMGNDAKAASDKGDNSKAMDISVQMAPLVSELQLRADSVCTAMEAHAGPRPTREQRAIQNAPAMAPEDTAAKVAGLTPVEYGQVKELIYTYLNYGKRAGVTEQEKSVIEAKRSQLKEAFKGIGMS
jgi:hypothetical protein